MDTKRGSDSINRQAMTQFFLFAIILALVLFVSGCGTNSKTKETGIPWPDNPELSFIQNENELMIKGSSETRKVASIDYLEGYDWSPNGKEIAFCSERQIYIISDDGARRNIGEGDYPQWSPDGTKIAYRQEVNANEGSANISRPMKLVVMEVESGKKQYIEEAILGVSFDWYYDSSKLFYWYFEDDSSDTKCYTYDMTSGVKDEILQDIPINTRLDYVVCSPVSSQMIIGIYHPHDQIKLALFNYITGETRDIYNDGAVIDVSWSPDGEMLAILKGKSTQESGFGVMLVSIEGGHTEALDDQTRGFGEGLGSNGQASWSSDGKKLVFTRNYNIKKSVPDIYIWHLPEDGASLSSQGSYGYVERITFKGSNRSPCWNPKY